MPRSSYGSGTIFKRAIWYVAYWISGRQVQKSSRSANIQDAKRLRDQILGRKARGEVAHVRLERVTCGELLDDFIEQAEANNKPASTKIWKLVIEANVRPFCGHLRAASLTTEKLKEYRRKRLTKGRSETTCNRELSILRMALNLGRKCTPPKVNALPYFSMVKEDNARQGFLTNSQYAKLRDALPDDLKPLFVCGYFTGVGWGNCSRGNGIKWTGSKVS